VATIGGSGGFGFAFTAAQSLPLVDLEISKILPHDAQQHLAVPEGAELLAKQ
jgi:hypothetical protein